MPEGLVEVRSLWRKPARGGRMQSVSRLGVSRTDGVCGDVSPGEGSPRQLLITSRSNLDAASLRDVDARCNLVLEGDVHPGALLRIGSVALRVTMPCPPCARGARLAGTSIERFAALPRYLAAVIEGGVLAVGDRVTHRSEWFGCAPDRLLDRCEWAVRAIPYGMVVSTGALLAATGADRAYARALPRWLAAAGLAGAPVHRVVRADPSDRAPSWAPDAATRLAAETARVTEFALGEALWFSGGIDRADVCAPGS